MSNQLKIDWTTEVRRKLLSATSFNWSVSALLLISCGGSAVDYSYTMGAMAHPTELPETTAARQTVVHYLNGLHGDLAQLQGMLGDTDKLIQGCLADREAAQVPLSSLRTDPFRSNSPAEVSAANVADVAESDGARVALLLEVGKLQLQSVVSSGEHPVCMIDNRFYHEGDQVGKFNVERIGDGEVVVRNGGYRFELRIAG